MLTNVDFYGRISTLIMFSPKRKRKIIIVKEITDTVPQNNIPHHNQNFGCDEEQEEMTNLNVNLEQATNYLIQLFYQTGEKYSCTRSKIGKMLSIVAFKYACEDKLAFNETIYKYDSCGTAIKEITYRFTDSNIYTIYVVSDNSKKIHEKFNKKASIPSDFLPIEQLSSDIKKTIESVFLSFAAFSPKELGECLNAIVNLEGITNDDGLVNVTKVGKLKLKDFTDQEENNPLLKFLYK